MPRCWLMKSEPDVYSIEDLLRDGRTSWGGIRNYQARNLLRDEVKLGDRVLFYHSNANPTGIVGIASVVREGYPDPSAFDRTSTYFDARSTPENPVWIAVDIGFVERLPNIVSLAQLKADEVLRGMMVAKKGARLSVQPVDEPHYLRVVALGRG